MSRGKEKKNLFCFCPNIDNKQKHVDVYMSLGLYLGWLGNNPKD